MANMVYVIKLKNVDYLDMEEVLIIGTDKDEADIAVEDYYKREWASLDADNIAFYKDFENFKDAFSEDGDHYPLYPLK